MSNSVYIVRTIFQNAEPSGAIVSETYGIRIYDDYANAYSNLVEGRETLLGLSPDDLFEMAWEAARFTIDAALRAGDPIWVDDEIYLETESETDVEAESVDEEPRFERVIRPDDADGTAVIGISSDMRYVNNPAL